MSKLDSRAALTDLEKALSYYRAGLEKKRPEYIPKVIRLHTRVHSDIPFLSPEARGYYAGPGDFECQCNQWGAVSVLAANGQLLGVKPDEFEVIEWRLNPKQ